MSELLWEILEQKGWRQFCVISGASICKIHCEPGLLSTHQYILITQTCDLLARRNEAEPWVELLQVVECDKSVYGNTKNGKSSKNYGLKLDDKYYCISNIRKFIIPRQILIEIEPLDLGLGTQEKKSICNWLANRYKRVAFPNNFVNQFNPCVKKFNNGFNQFNDISTVLIHLDIEEKTIYEIEIIFLISALKDGYNFSEIEDYCYEFIEYVENETSIKIINDQIIYFEEEMTLAHYREFYAWNFDVLSNVEGGVFPVE